MSELSPDAAAINVEVEPFCPTQARIYVLISAILASSMGFIDSSVVSLALPAIRLDLGASLADAQWIFNAYLLFLASLVLTGGAAGDVFGVRNVFGVGVGLFMATSLLCAIAPDAETLIIMRGAQGIGAAIMVPGSLSIIAKAYPRGSRGKAIGTWAAASSITTAFGPMVGSLVLSFGDAWMWRLIFAINVPIGVLVLVMLFAKVPADRRDSARELDLFGAVIATASLGAMAWGLTGLGLPADSAFLPAWSWLLAGAGLAALFVWWERHAAAPMVKLELFRSRAFAGANLFTLLLFLAFSSILFFLPMTLIGGWDVIEWEASLMFLPLSIFIGGFSRQAGVLADRFGPKWLLVAGACCLTVSYAALGLTMSLMQLWKITFPIMLLKGVGMGLVISPLSTAVMQAAPASDSGLASGVNNSISRAAGLIAIASFGALAGTVYRSSDKATGGLAFGEKMEQGISAGTMEAHIAASNAAFQAIAFGCCGICLLAALVALTTKPAWDRSKEQVLSG